MEVCTFVISTPFYRFRETADRQYLHDGNEIAVKADGLVRYFNGFEAVRSIDLSIRRGEIFGIVGPNGAGKTTLLKMITGLLRPSVGKISVLGYDSVRDTIKVKENIGYLPEEDSLYEEMSIMDYLHLFSDLYLTKRSEADMRISENLSRLSIRNTGVVGDLSKGMKRKIAITRSLLHDPPVLIYDEPTSGLDVISIRAIIKHIKNLARQGKTIVFSAHNMAQVEYVCDRIAIVNNGRIIALASMDELLSKYGSKKYLIDFESPENQKVPASFHAKSNQDRGYSVQYENIDETNALLQWLGRTGGRTLSITTKSDSLEDIFLGLVDGSHDIE